MHSLISIKEIEAAQVRLADQIARTPLLPSRSLSNKFSRPILLKAENLQRTGSFKIRGAYNMIAQLSPTERARGVVAASAGNHAQGVALAASLLKTTSTVFMPESTPLPKIQATRAYDAEVKLVKGSVETCLQSAQDFSSQSDAVFIPPFDHHDIIAGSGTLGLELAEEAPPNTTILVPIGGGGLIAGVATACANRRSDINLIGVQAEAANACQRSLQAEEIVNTPPGKTIADGIAVASPGEITFPHIQKFVNEIVTVDEEAISQALLFLLERTKLLVEPAAATTIAALEKLPQKQDRPVVALLSGGNVDPNLLTRLIRHGLTTAGRYLILESAIPDQPGELAHFLEIVATAKGNILSVDHQRFGVYVPIGMVDIRLTIETHDNEHADEIIRRLRERNYAITVLSTSGRHNHQNG